MAKLYKIDGSPPARSAMMASEIFNVPIQMVDVNILNNEQMTPEYLEMNPVHTVPTLIDGDITLHDSHAILTYFADVYGKDDTWYPKDVKKRALVTQKLFFDATILFPRIRNVTFPFFRFNESKVPAQKVADIEEAFSFMEAFLSKTKFLALDHMTLADVASVPSVAALSCIVPLDQQKYPKTSAWLNEMEKQPFWKNHGESGALWFKEFAKNFTLER